MKTRTEKLLLVLILLVSIMAIVITASQIYEIINNEIIKDNNIGQIEGDENDSSLGENTIFNTNFNFYNKNYDAADGSTNKNDYTSVIDDNSLTYIKKDIKYPEESSNNHDFYVYYKTEISLPNDLSLNNNNSCLSTFSGKNVRFVYDNEAAMAVPKIFEYKVTRKNSGGNSVNPFNVYNSVSEFEEKFFNFDENNEISSIKYLSSNNQHIEICASGIVFNNDEDSAFPPTATILNICKTYSEGSPSADSFFAVYNCNIEILNNYYPVAQNHVVVGNSNNVYYQETSDFTQVESVYNNTTLFTKNITDTLSEWKNGKETATLKCSIGEYYDESGNLVISTKNNDLPMLFKIGDLVIPYVPISNGRTEPISIRQDGNAKIFQVTQVRPYFDGACWQEITLQEANTQ